MKTGEWRSNISLKGVNKNISGQITIFSAVILLSVLTLAGVLVDISRISAGKAMVKRAAGSAARSLLAGYGSRLKEDYGIFAIPGTENEELKDLFEEYLSAGLSIPGGEENINADAEDRTDLFGFRIEKISVTPMYNLSENKATKRQILEYMKYRAPAGLAESFIERLKAIKDVGKMSAAYKQKVGIDKILGSMDKSQQNLKKSVDGMGNPEDIFINGFNQEGSWERIYDEYNSTADKLASIREKLADLEGGGTDGKADSDLDGTGSDSADGGASRPGNATEDRPEAEKSALEQARSEAESLLKELWNQLRNSLTRDYIKVNDTAAAEIEKIAEKGIEAGNAIESLKSYMDKNFGGEEGAFSTDFNEQTRTELEKLKELILDGRRAGEILNSVNKNSSLLKNIISKLDGADAGGGSGTSGEVLSPELPDMIKDYENVSYDYAKPEKGDKKDDPREGKAEAVREFISDKILKDINYLTEGIDAESLPSRTKAVTQSFDDEDGEASYEGDLENVGEEADLYDEEGMFQENALGFIADIGDIIAGSAEDLRDNIYLNEYIMGSFKSSVTKIRKGDETTEDVNLHGIEKDSLQTFYDSEVEYILHGNPSQKLNNIMTKGEILLMRFGLNTLHVYTDSRKRAAASGTAAAVAGWWTGGAGIPAVANLIMCGWGMGEALLDMSDLMDGKSVPIYKMQGDWKLDIGLPAASGAKTNRSLYFNYHDYLRLFLLVMDENTKLDRIEDLIQLNIGQSKDGFKMSDCGTFVRVEAEVSMKYLFITMPFIRKEVKTKDGRYIFKVLVYEGY